MFSNFYELNFNSHIDWIYVFLTLQRNSESMHYAKISYFYYHTWKLLSWNNLRKTSLILKFLIFSIFLKEYNVFTHSVTLKLFILLKMKEVNDKKKIEKTRWFWSFSLQKGFSQFLMAILILMTIHTLSPTSPPIPCDICNVYHMRYSNRWQGIVFPKLLIFRNFGVHTF